MGTAAIVAAGGRGERAATLKQFHVLGGRPLVHWSIDVLIEAGCDPVIVVVPREELDSAARTVARDGVDYVAGGATRRASVRNGLAAIESEFVTVHDAARPFVTAEMVTRTTDALDGADGAVVGLPMDETLKRVDDAAVVETVERGALWRVQTPQTFRTDRLRQAHERAAAAGIEATDDAQLVERDGGRIVVVPGSRMNLKLTYPEDFALAEAILKARG
ncbi:MAG: 2-C-methyl-D-erythritol 4-phosphate cytidylyltransferase [Actinomycetota bacterium]